MSSRTMRIGELAAASGLTRDALRYYERRGLLPRSRRTSGGFREYNSAAVDRVRFVKQALARCLTLREIRDLVSHQSDAGRTRCRHVRDLLARKLGQLENRRAELDAFLHNASRVPRHVRPRARRADTGGVPRRRQSWSESKTVTHSTRARCSAVGALTSAGTVATTILCCLPFATGVIGAGVATLGARFAPLQPYLIGVSVGMLAYAFYQAYRSDVSCVAEGCDVPTVVRRPRIVLWVVAVAVLALLTTSWWVNWVIYWSL